MEEKEINQIIEEVTRNNFDSYVLVSNKEGDLTIRNKSNHFFKIIEDSEGSSFIINYLVNSGIEVFPDEETFGNKYPRKRHYPDGFPKDGME